jgi:hypothetical protein
MMKRTLVGALVAALALIGTGCKSSSSTTLEKPNVTAVATDSGATLHLSWAAVDGATSYEITAGSSVDTTTSTSFDVSTPTAIILVRSLNGSSKSDTSATIDCKVIETTIDVFGDLDTTHANGFGFNDSGAAIAYRIVYYQIGFMDFYLSNMMLVSGSKVNPTTRAGNALKNASGSFDSLKLADAPGTYADSDLAITATSSYFLTTSSDTAAWSAGRNYAKASVVAIDSSKVTLRLGYQSIGGLRWLIK